MMIRCPACDAHLRVKDERLSARATARCPRCGGPVPVGPAASAGEAPAPIATIRVQCGSCGASLKAPASSAGARSHCPKCRGEVVIRAAEAPRGAPRAPQEDTGGAATRRMDSRSLGLAGMTAPPAAPAAIDLEAFIKSGDPTPAVPQADGAGVAAALMRPPVAEMEKIAGDIRDAARTFDPADPPDPPAAERPPRATAPAAAAAVGEAGMTHSRKEPAHHRPAPELKRAARPFPATRGLWIGGLAGLLVGAVSAALVRFAPAGIAAFIAPLPLGDNSQGASDTALRLLLPAMLGALAGFNAAAAGSPSCDDHPLRLFRSVGFALLAGLACGLVSTVSSDGGLTVWPIANWMRDMLVAGLIISGLNCLVPGPQDRA